MLRISFAQLPDSTWGVKVGGDLGGRATKMAGETVTVSKRNGGSEQVTLGSLVTQANGGRSAWYRKQQQSNARNARQRIAGTATDRQYAFLQSLLTERDPGDDTMFNPLPSQDQLTKRDASQLIERLKEHPKRDNCDDLHDVNGKCE